MFGKVRNGKVVFLLLILMISILWIRPFVGISEAETCWCTDYAWSKRPDLVGICTGNAADWASQASTAGYSVDTSPQKGDIAVFQYGHHGTLDTRGHVAYVEKKNSDGTFNISEQGYTYGGVNSCDTHYRYNLQIESSDQFIHTKRPVPVLNSDIGISPNPATGGANVEFSFQIANTGVSELHIKKIFVRSHDPSGNPWEDPGEEGDIIVPAGGDRDFTLQSTVPIGNPGTWQIQNIELLEETEGWMDVDENDHAYPSYQVDPADTTPPTGHFVNTPTTVDLTLDITAQVEDTTSGVAWVRMSVWPQGGGSTDVNMTYNGTIQLYEASYSTNQYPNGTVLEYLLWAGDHAGNSRQITGVTNSTVVRTVDRAMPTGYFVNLPGTAHWDMIIQAEITDDFSGVAGADLHVSKQGGGFTSPMQNIGGNTWQATVHVSGFAHGTILEYLIHSWDHAGNAGQITGVSSTTVICKDGVSPNNWCAEYYNNTSLNGMPATVQAEGGTYIDRNYELGGPGGTDLGVDHFSIQWAKRVYFAEGNYTFDSWSDDGVRVIVDGSTIIDSWVPGGSQSHQHTMHLSEGVHHVVYEYVEYTSWAYARLLW